MKKPKYRQILRVINHYVVFFLLVAFVVTCCMTLFITTMSRTMKLTFTSENIGVAAKITFLNVILLTVIFTSVDFWRRKLTVTRPVKIITDATQRIMEGDFSVRIPPMPDFAGETGFNEIIGCLNKMTAELQGTETLRTDFIANVSHELKTPLQGIIGSAELLESGLAKPEDQPRFIGHIRKEASRLVNLIEDIIRLSQLDEGMELPSEQVDILQLCQDVKEILEPSAAEKNITIDVTGNGFTIQGVRRMLQEIIYNLCDNAIKYNVPGGSVTIQADNNRLVVSDTGIGIPAEHKERIFERFYRVDKSHSKASGGTGLGLSIVKHAVAYHNAEIALESTPGKGTTITVIF